MDEFAELDSLMLNEADFHDVDSGDGIMRTNEQMEKWAKAMGCRFEVAGDDELFIDIDTKEQLATFNYNKGLAHHLFDTKRDKQSVRITESKSGGEHKHIRVKLWSPLPLPVRIMLQACLGSDLRREMMSYKRYLDTEENVVVFFEREG